MPSVLIRERVRRLALAAQRSHAVWEVDREARDAAIEDADLDGFSLREIADLTGLTSQRVHQVVLERTAARQHRLAKKVGLA